MSQDNPTSVKWFSTSVELILDLSHVSGEPENGRNPRSLTAVGGRYPKTSSHNPGPLRMAFVLMSRKSGCEQFDGLSTSEPETDQHGRFSHIASHKCTGHDPGWFELMATADNSYFHLHMISDSTGETLITVARAVAAQYASVTPVEHVYPLVRSQKQLDRVLDEIEEAPGIVLFTLLEKDLVARLEAKCQQINIPSLSIIGPVMQLFQAYLGAPTTGRVGAQHTLNAEYFKRIDALNYTMMHDDGQHVEGLDEADVILVGVSRTSKTPTSIYLANRGIRTANVPLVPGIPIPHQLETLTKPLVVSLHATPERLIQVRQNRLLSMGDRDNDTYIDRQSVTDEVAYARKLSAKFNWAQLDVTRPSIEEPAAAILKLFADRQRHRLSDE